MPSTVLIVWILNGTIYFLRYQRYYSTKGGRFSVNTVKTENNFFIFELWWKDRDFNLEVIDPSRIIFTSALIPPTHELVAKKSASSVTGDPDKIISLDWLIYFVISAYVYFVCLHVKFDILYLFVT
jgi:hypothetical protein